MEKNGKGKLSRVTVGDAGLCPSGYTNGVAVKQKSVIIYESREEEQ